MEPTVNNKSNKVILIESQAEPYRPYPKHWGNPPMSPTPSSVKVPEKYGFGKNFNVSLTELNWIKENIKKDKLDK